MYTHVLAASRILWPKLFSSEAATEIRNQHRHCAKVLTHHYFDLLDVGHIFSPQQSAKFRELWVRLKGDENTHQVKGPPRPMIKER
jgi:bifunctional ADP-heptose synthase (sugar kinase/adenylyltransferase)